MKDVNTNSSKTISIEVYGKVVCFCFNITYGDISRCIEENNIKTFDELTECTKITKACNACKKEVMMLFDSLKK